MVKHIGYPPASGKLTGARLEIRAVVNRGLAEYVIISNRGTMAQPMADWVLVSAKGGQCFRFPDHLILLSGKEVVVYSGQNAPDAFLRYRVQVELRWTNEQVWNNRCDTAILFNANREEVACYTYPPHPVSPTGRCIPLRRKLTVDEQGVYRIVSKVRPRSRRREMNPIHSRRNRLPR